MPHLSSPFHLNFYGGEPLLCFDLIQQIVSFLDEKNREPQKTVLFSVTTNGSLITEDILRTLSGHRFSIIFSFDGLAQDVQRKPGTLKKAVDAIRKIQKYPRIHLEVNSVFTPETVGCLSESMDFIMNLGIADINLSLSYIQPWNRNSLAKLDDEMTKLRKILVALYRKSGQIPVISFREEEKGFFYCAGGQDRLAVTSDGQIWGCDLFADHLRGKERSPEYHEFFFGDLDTFTREYQKTFLRISSHYARLAMDNYETPQRKCLFCENLEQCTVCPVSAAFSGCPFGNIPPYVCEVQKIKIRERKKFREEAR